jgi:hypothetical protein
LPARDILFTNGSTRERDMESDSELLRWLKVLFLYKAFQAAVGATVLLRRLIQNHVWTKAGDTVIDIGSREFAIHMSDESKVDA